MNRSADQLNGWKEIACHLNRSVRCVQRWERTENLPVRRHGHRRGVSVYAFREELSAWWARECPDSRQSTNDRSASVAGTKREASVKAIVGETTLLTPDAQEHAGNHLHEADFALTAREVTALRFLLMLLSAGIPHNFHSSAAP